jgi:hypothetical protein
MHEASALLELVDHQGRVPQIPSLVELVVASDPRVLHAAARARHVQRPRWAALPDHLLQFCSFQLKQRGKAKGGVQTYRWILEQCLSFVRRREGRVAGIADMTASTIQAWMDYMAADDLALSTMRQRQSTVSSLCTWLVKRGVIAVNPGHAA